MLTFNFPVIFSGIVITVSTLVLQTLLPVAFFTLLERRLMSLVQRRLGPNAIGLYGVLQPIADGVKLMIKEGITPRFASKALFFAAPTLSLVVAFTCWLIIPLSSTSFAFESDISLISFLAFSSVSVYGLVLAGWASYSRYALMGALRAIAQLVSYEVVLTLTLFPVILYSGSFSFLSIVQVQAESCWFVFPCLPAAMMFYIIVLAETNRTPFDLPEAEAELVSGFNVEYSSIMFALFFLAEYSNMLLMSTLFCLLFLGGWSEGAVVFVLKIVATAYSLVLVRALVPRYRYDQLMFLCWRTFLPLALGFYVFVLGVCIAFDAAPYNVEQLYSIWVGETRPWMVTYF